MRTARVCILVSLAAFNTACATNYYLSEDALAAEHKRYPEGVFIAPSSDPGYELLKTSGIYARQDAASASAHVRIVGLEPEDGCANEFLLSFITFGIVPATNLSYYTLTYDITESGITTQYSHELPLWTRTSVWEWFLKPFADSENDLMVEALRRSDRVKLQSN